MELLGFTIFVLQLPHGFHSLNDSWSLAVAAVAGMVAVVAVVVVVLVVGAAVTPVAVVAAVLLLFFLQVLLSRGGQQPGRPGQLS